MERAQTANMKQVREQNDKCELCGSQRSLEVHHIIPVAFGGDDSLDNLICVCNSCHGKLTPRKLLIRRGIEKKQWEVDFWKHFMNMCDDNNPPDTCDVFDYCEHTLFPLFRAMKE